MKIWRRVYSSYCLLVFSILFLLLLPFFLIFVQKEAWHLYALRLNKVWSKLFFFFCFIPLEVEYRQKYDKKKQYVLCSNHFSFLDIATMALAKNDFVFVGKSSIQKVPVFGYMFKKLHITVDRKSLRNRYETLQKSANAIDQGKSVAIYPEGGIVSDAPPKMGKFKDGPFRLAIEKQIPVIPVTLPFNYLILPDDGTLLVRRHKAKVIFHEEINTQGMTLENLETLKEQTYNIIDKELKKHTL